MCNILLNQAHAWFLKIDPVQIVGMRVHVCIYPRPRLLITSGVIWGTSYDWLTSSTAVIWQL